MKKIAFVSPVTYSPDYSGNSSRVKQLMSSFASADKDVEVYFVLCPLHKFESGYTGELPNDSVTKVILNQSKKYKFTFFQFLLNTFRAALKKYLHLSFELLDDYMFADGLICNQAINDVTATIEKIKPDMIVIEYAVLSKLLVNIPKNIIKVVDTHDRFSDRNKRIRKSGGDGFWLSLSQRQEANLLKRFDVVIAIQENEGAFFNSILSRYETKVETISITKRSIARNTELQYKEHSPIKIGFIGSNNKHNKEALDYFIQSCWQKIKNKVPNIQLMVAGTVLVDSNFLKNSAIQHLGKVPSLRDFYDKCDFIINPCMSGSGLKIKSVEALAFGKVLVTTPEGAEGLYNAQEYGIFIRLMDDNNFTECCIELCNDRKKLASLAAKNCEYIDSLYDESLQKIRKVLREIK